EKLKNQMAITSENDLLSVNFLNVDIREALSALAMEREINIVTSQEVSGMISVHLFGVGLDEALRAISLAGGFNFQKQGEMYYIYKPKERIDPDIRNLETRTLKLKYAEVGKVQEAVNQMEGMRKIKSHEPSGTIIIEDTRNNIERVESLIRHMDVMPKQVMIEAKILEVSLTDDMAFGVNWNDFLYKGAVELGTGGFTTAIKPVDVPISPVPATGTGLFSNIITRAGTREQFTAALDILQTKTKVNTLSTPKILAIHGKPAKVQVGGQQGYKVTTSNLGVATETIQFIDTGTILDITPYIDDDGNVLLNVKPSINSAKIEAGIPVVSSTAVSTWLIAKNGETVFIGGLIQDTKTKTREMIPCLGGLPLFGAAFGRTVQGTGKSELIVLITPKILEPDDQASHQGPIKKMEEAVEELEKSKGSTLKEFWEFLRPVE
ncbi:MAG: secretin N-terminal domain-containing protein, partial [Pseudomonadota bacterium]